MTFCEPKSLFLSVKEYFPAFFRVRHILPYLFILHVLRFFVENSKISEKNERIFDPDPTSGADLGYYEPAGHF